MKPDDATPLVFIHGIKGSLLADQNGKVCWVGPLEALGLRTPRLALPLSWSATGQDRDELRATAPMDGVTVIPKLAEEKVYGPWLHAARSHRRPFYPFAYDWRRDNLETLANFRAFVEDVRTRHPGRRVVVAAHSMGGLLALALLNQEPDWFARVYFIGVPFHGGIGFLADLHKGAPTGLNRKILSQRVLFTFCSPYTLFPLDGSGLIEADGRPITMDFFDAAMWQDKGLSIFSDGHPVGVEHVAHLGRALAQAKAFRSLLIAKPIQYPPIVVVRANNRPTLATLMHNGPRAVRGWDFDTPPKQPGDGRVIEPHAAPPQGIPFEVLPSDEEHSLLLNDPKVIAAILTTRSDP